MFPATHLALFVATSLALIVAPGPDILYVITRGVSQGRKAAFVSALGVCSGILVHTTAAALGLSAILRASALAFTIIKAIGAAYLVYLGIKTLRSRTSFLQPGKVAATRLSSVYRQGVASNVFNPKVALFFLAFLPQFVSPAGGNVALQMIVLGGLFMLMGLCFLSLVACAAGQLGEWLVTRRRITAILRWVTGGVFVLLGVRLAFTERS